MIKANELRIGNWVKERITMMQEKEPSVVVNEHYIQIASNHFCGTGYGFFPITLTPEILEKCGFKIESFYSDNDYSVYIDHNSELFLELDWRRRDEGFDPKVIDEELRSIGINIKYLHQLQNLFFALTGEELKINLNWTIAAS